MIALAPPPAPARPRVLLIGTALTAGVAILFFGGLLAVYFSARAAAVAATGSWLPEGVTIPLTPGNMALAGLLMSSVLVQWAVHAVGNDDRPAAYFALGLTLVMGGAYLLEIAYYYTQMGLPLREPSGVGVLIYTITGAHLALGGGAMLFVLVMTFRTLGGQYSSRDREGVAAAALLWHTSVVIYFALWWAIFITK